MTDVVDLIVQDHRELQQMFGELRSAPSKRKALAPVVSTLLFRSQPCRGVRGLPACPHRGW